MWRGGPGSAGGVRTALPAACCCLGWAPLRLHRRYLPNYSYFPAAGRIRARIPPVPAQPFPASLLGWERRVPPPCLQPPRPSALPAQGEGLSKGTPRFTPATCLKDEANAIPTPQGDTCAGWAGGALQGVPVLPPPLSLGNPARPGCPFPHRQARPCHQTKPPLLPAGSRAGGLAPRPVGTGAAGWGPCMKPDPGLCPCHRREGHRTLCLCRVGCRRYSPPLRPPKTSPCQHMPPPETQLGAGGDAELSP